MRVFRAGAETRAVAKSNFRPATRHVWKTESPLKRFGVSKDYDLAVASQKDVVPTLEMLEDVENTVAVGDEVVVLGNSLGSEVITEISGKVTGLGPDLVEVDAKFVHGNSGSPILHVKSGKVLAIATFATVRKLTSLDKDSNFSEIRRFGYRLDTATKWDFPKWSRFVEEGATIERIQRVTDALLTLAVDIYDDGFVRMDPHQAADNPVRQSVTDYLRIIDSSSTVANADIAAAKESFIRHLIFVSKRDVAKLDLSNFSSWHRRDGERELDNRAFLRKKFGELANRQVADRKIRLP